MRDGSGRRVQMYGSRPSKLAFTRESAPQTHEELERLAATAAPQSGDESQAKPGDGGARAPGMFLNRLNPYRGLDAEQRKALMAAFAEQQVAWGDRDLRLKLMDEQGIHAAILYPGHVLNLEFEFADDVDAIYANARAYNRWIHAEVGYAHAGRMFLPPYVSLADVDLAVEELERVLAEGAPLVEVITGHAHGGPREPARRPLARGSDLRPVLGARERGARARGAPTSGRPTTRSTAPISARTPTRCCATSTRSSGRSTGATGPRWTRWRR